MSREGDWICTACNHLNFRKRDSCQRCTCPKNATGVDLSSYGLHNSQVLAGDWYCGSSNCGAHNYASRTSCHRCGAFKDYCGYGASLMIPSTGCAYDPNVLPGWKPGDWICNRLGCGMHNYASRMECFKCKSPKGFWRSNVSKQSIYSTV
ncbi:Ran BP2/NZF zinc finger-like superfamily protein [Abeliophyllum distichum]|uniref:Ran BP2/NZF zinc finger-like superfamily protein n=1 Tax=Abeliophyllum distichum TaxID=126358 RepID=A0ABD1V725_9LAMI